MSIEVMSLVFKAEIKDLEYKKKGKKRKAKASTVKLILLSYADHANDEGEGAYPGYDKLEIKTALSRQGIADTLEAVKQNDLMTFEGISKFGTNSYRINKTKLQGLVKRLDSCESSDMTTPSQVAGLKPSSPPSVKPSIKRKKAAEPQPPEILLYREVVNHYPKKQQREMVIEAIKKVNARLGRDATLEDLQPFFSAWCKVSANDWSLVWLMDWAVPGTINGKVNHAETPKRVEKQPSAELLERARKINELRSAGHVV
jgi:hypothetical protein